MKKLTASEINELLESSRHKKFRHLTESELQRREALRRVGLDRANNTDRMERMLQGVTPEGRNRMAKHKQGKALPEQHRDNIAQARTGTERSAETGKKISQHNRTREQHYRPVMTPDGEFPSLQAAADHYGYRKARVASYARNKRNGFYYPGTRSKKLLVEGRLFDNIQECADHYGLKRGGVGYRLKSPNWPEWQHA